MDQQNIEIETLQKRLRILNDMFLACKDFLDSTATYEFLSNISRFFIKPLKKILNFKRKLFSNS